jgi:hypothetical protein
MRFEDSIGKNKIQAIFERMKSGNSLIRMKLMGKDYEKLTIIGDIRCIGKAMYLLIDCPNGFVDLIDDASRQIQFEFTGPDKLSYYFYADIAKIDSGNIWILFPDLIRRRQLRHDFRVDVPYGTQMTFKKNGERLTNQVINLSLGGSFGALISSHNMVPPVWPLCVGDVLSDIELIFKTKIFEQRVSIRKASIVRFEENPVLHGYCCAIHFVNMDKSERKALTELIYVIQREYLQKRLPVAD